jgi:hypothetical protein
MNTPMTAERAAEEIEYRLRQYDMEFGPTAAQRFRDAIRTLRAPAGEPVAALAEAARDVAMNGYSALRHTNLRNAVARYFTTPPVVSSPPSDDAWRCSNVECECRDPSPAEQGAREEPRVLSATVRDTDSDELHIECRFAYGEKYAAVKVDADKPVLADAICDFLNGKRAPLAAGRVGVAEQTMTHVRKLMDEIHAENDDPYITHRLDQIASLLAGPVVAGECIWSQQDSGGDWVSTACGNEFVLNDASQYPDGGQVFPHCPYCAKPTTFRRWSLVYADTAKGNGNG